ncbi:MAG: hypothetical protein KKD35_03340 [Elusimicrobia bacterium]|nr:hypothetical protein [Elusimicrobiota bacterium]
MIPPLKIQNLEIISVDRIVYFLESLIAFLKVIIILLIAAYLFYRLGFRLTRLENGLQEKKLIYKTEEPSIIVS